MAFSAGTLDFLFENRLNNSRAWFEAHKEDYRRLVLAPLQELVRALTPCVLEIDGELATEPRVDRTICRIRRDTRFSHDKSLYRDNMWIIFKRGRMHGTEMPGLYFEISERGFEYGCGYYAASASYMSAYRSLILAGDAAFERARRAFEHQKVYALTGGCYKRPHYPDQPEQLRAWLERRQICFTAQSADFPLLFSQGLADKLAEDFRLLAPIYRFLLRAAQVERQHQARTP